MADNDEDDDSFGEFTFAPIQTKVNPPSQVPVTTGNDDDWGNFNLFQTNATDQNPKSPPPQPQPKWEKIQGALPLSFFGDDDEAMDDVKQSNFSGCSGFVSDNRSNAHLGINDLIANLYGPRQQQQQTNNSTVSKDHLSESNSLSSFSLNTVSAAPGNQGSDDEGGWEFVDASAHNVKDHKGLSEKTVSSPVVQGGSHGAIDLFAVPNNGFFVEAHVTDSGFDFKPITNFQNGFSGELKADSKGTTNELSSNPVGGSDDFDDTFGEFETAFMENSSAKKELFKERFDPLGSHDTSHGSVDLFSFSNGVPGGSHMENNGFDFSQIPVVENGFASDPFSQTEGKEAKDDPDSQPPDVGADDESFGKFETTFQESGSKPQGFEASTKNYKEPVPLSIFGIEEDPEADNSLNLEHELFKSSTHGKHTRNLSSNLSINDILSDLYSQAQPVSSDGKEDLMHSTGKEYGSHVVDDNDDDFNDGSWEFKDAFFQSRAENQSSFQKKLNNCMDFYSNLKDDLCVIARQHLHSLKKAQSTTTLAGEEMKVTALNKEIQEALEKLHQKDIISTEMPLDDQSERVISLKKYIEIFQEPDFQVLESEYHISRRMILAESDLPTAVDLINHFTTVLKILTLAPKCEPADYVSLWFKVISVCSQELNHGTWIWKQSLEKNVHIQILSEKQGRQFIIALGEIYRAVMILEAAVKFYKPWILLSGADLDGIYGLLEECHSLWSTSGLEEPTPADYLLQSITRIQNLDEHAIAEFLFSQEESQCGLSLLSPAVVPEMKMVIWNEDKYFVTLANLWANLISPNPPKLSIHFG
ncbi:hypothetical protein L1987_45654 [Smallanthus sonchifolius]|uniref:Uncharacterized protein n=1 Tax=Smallanthus sonchifolius TaxID=185202 RepID=A0ACB9FXL4_9ASTR|nr:hypothetical protein L1987_45654 [Smallanthus sonchifolius]